MDCLKVNQPMPETAPIPLLLPGTKAESQWKVSASAASPFCIAGPRFPKYFLAVSTVWRFGARYGSMFLTAGLRLKFRPRRESLEQMREANNCRKLAKLHARDAAVTVLHTSRATRNRMKHCQLALRTPAIAAQMGRRSEQLVSCAASSLGSKLSPVSIRLQSSHKFSFTSPSGLLNSLLSQAALGRSRHTAFKDARGFEG